MVILFVLCLGVLNFCAVGALCMFYHQENMSVKCIPNYTPLLYSKTGVWRGLLMFLILTPKHRFPRRF